jgi:acetyl-CoA decarbonylase/synthase complex subunit delta
MAFEIPKVTYTGKIREITIGVGEKAVTVGGESCYPFYLFEGEMPNPPRIAMEVYDHVDPEDWSKAALEPFRDVIDNPAEWAQKCVEEYNAEMIAVQLVSIDPNALNRPADEAVETVKRVVDSVDVPVIVWGCGDSEKDTETLRLVAEACEGRNLAIGPVVEENYRQLGATCIAYKHVAVASTPIDINLAKQLNILLGDLGVPDEQIIIDPTTGGLGYGIEYSYSVMERIRVAALAQHDDKLAYPMICNMGKEVWKVKEVKLSEEEAPTLGDLKKRGILMEAITAKMLLLAGADILIMRHPDAISLTREMIQELII